MTGFDFLDSRECIVPKGL